jgi:integrase
MVVLLMLTGEPMEHIRRIKGRDIDWDKGIWTVDRRAAPTVRLSPEAMALIQPYRDVDGYLFCSSRTKSGRSLFSPNLPMPINLYTEIIGRLRKTPWILPMPINFYTEIIERLRKKTWIPWTWSVRDLRRGVRSEIDRLGEGEDAVLLWSDRFTAALKHNYEEEVNL